MECAWFHPTFSSDEASVRPFFGVLAGEVQRLVDFLESFLGEGCCGLEMLFTALRRPLSG